MLNKKEIEILEYIRQRLNSGTSPTVREICNALEYSSTSTANRYINSLSEKGYIEIAQNQKRSIKLAKHISKIIPLVNIQKYIENFLSIECIMGYISWTPDNEYEYPLFAVKADYDYNNIIHSGDIIIAEKTFYDGRKYYIEPKDNRLVFTENYSLKCIGRIISVIKYI